MAAAAKGARRKTEEAAPAPSVFSESAPAGSETGRQTAGETAGEESTAMNTVTVAYNHPRSIVFDVVDKNGVRHDVRINGNATHLRGLDTGALPTGGQYGLTPGVNAELWEAVKTKFGNMAIFRNGLIFATAPKDAAAAAEDHKSVRNGFEPVDTAKSRTQAADA